MYQINKIDPKKVVVAVLLLFCVCSFCHAQTSVKGGLSVLSNANARLQTKITYSCQDLPIELMLKELAEIARSVQPKKLVLYHTLLWGASKQDLLDEISEIYDGEVIFGNDLDIIDL